MGELMKTRIPLFLAFALLAGSAMAGTYRWVDSQGKVHYGDVMPPQQAGMGHQELDKQGRVIKNQPRTLLSADERRRRAEEIADREEQHRRAEEQQRRDRALLSTYASEREIDLARERAMALEKLARDSLQSRMDTSAAKLAFANSQLARFRAARATEPANLIQMRDEAQEELAQIGESLKQREKTLTELKGRFDDDKDRFRELLELKAVSRE